MKIINVRFIVLMVAVLAVIGGIGYGVHSYQTKRHAGFFLERAQKAEDLGDVREALKELGHYLRLVPEDAKARAHMGVLLADSRQDYAAFTVLEKALRQVDDDEARRALVDVLLRMGRWSDARTHLDEHLLPAAPDDAKLLECLAQCQWADKEYAEAQVSLERAIELDAQRINSYLRLIGLLSGQPQLVKQDDEGVSRDAEYWRAQMIQANPEAIAVYLSRAGVRLAAAMSVIRSKARSEKDRLSVQESCQAVLQDAELARGLARKAGEQFVALRGGVGEEAGEGAGEDSDEEGEQEQEKEKGHGQEIEDAGDSLETARRYMASLGQAEEIIDAVERLLDVSADAKLVVEKLAVLEQIARIAQAETVWLAASSKWGLAIIGDGEPDASELDAARKLAQEGLELQGQDARLYAILAEVELAAGDRLAAKVWLRQGAEKVESRSNLAVNLARMELEDGRTAEARQAIEIMARKEFSAPLINYLSARAEFGDGHWQKAVKLLGDASAQTAEAPELAKEIEYWFGRCYQNLQKADLEMQAYRRALVIDPQYSRARLMLAEALRRRGQWDQALEQYRAGLAETPESALLVARVQVQKNLSLLASRRDWKSVEAVLDELAKTMPDNPDLILLRADTLVAQSKNPEALTLLEEAVTKVPDSVAIRCALAQLVMQDGEEPDYDKAAKLLDDAQEQLGDSVAIRLTRGNLAVRRQDDQAGAELRQLAGDTEQFAVKDRLRLWRRLAQLASASGDLEQALKLTQQVAEQEPNDLSIWLQMLAVVLEQNDFAAADGVLTRIAQVEGGSKGPIWSYCKAATFATHAEETDSKAPSGSNSPQGVPLSQGGPQGVPENVPLSQGGPQGVPKNGVNNSRAGAKTLRDQALEHISKTLAARPDWSRALLLGAVLAEKQGDSKLATTRYLKLIELGNDSTQVMREAIRLLTAQARYLDADSILTRLEQRSGVITPELARFRARISGGLEDFEAALPAARTVAETSEDYQDHLWLARLCGLFAVRKQATGAGDGAAVLVTEGEKALQKAEQLAPDAVDMWAVRLQFLVRLDRKEEVETVLAAAKSRFADDLGVLASLYLAASQLDRAASQFEADLARGPEDIQLVRRAAEFCLRTGRPQLATDQLQAIVTGRVEVEPKDLIWSRRVLALAFRAEEDGSKLDAALALIDQNLQASPSSVLDLRTQALLLTDSSDPVRRSKARQILEKLIRSKAPGQADTRRLLAQMYLADGDWTSALPHLRLATDPVSITRYIRAMLDRSQLKEAELGVVRLEEIAPGQLGTIVFRARVLFRQGEYQRAEKVIDGLVTPSAASGDETSVAPGKVSSGNVLAAAMLLEEFANQVTGSRAEATASRLLAKAEVLLRGYAELGPDQNVALAAFLARNDKADETLTILEANVATLSVAAIAQGTGAFGFAEMLDDKTLVRLDSIFEAALQKHDRPLELLDARARVMIAAQRFDEAVAMYREILTKDSTNFAVKNNLAELLALRGQSLDEALTMIQETIQAVGPQPPLLDTRATVYFARGEFDRAVADMQTVVAEVPRPNRYFHLARALRAAGLEAEAHDAMRQAQARGLRAEDLHPLERDAYGEFNED